MSCRSVRLAPRAAAESTERKLAELNRDLEKEVNRDALGPEDLAPLRRVRPAIRQMTVILDRMLGLSAVTHASFGRQRFDMRELVTEVYNELSAVEPDKPADFEFADLPPVNANRKLVKILPINLLGNAMSGRMACPAAEPCSTLLWSRRGRRMTAEPTGPCAVLEIWGTQRKLYNAISGPMDGA